LIPAYDLLAKVYEAMGDLEQAQQRLKEGATRAPLTIQRQLELGRVATHTKQLGMAEQAYRKSISLGENSCQAVPESFLCLANVQRMQMEGAEGRAKQDAIISIDRLLAQAKRKFSRDPQVKLASELLMAQVFEDAGDEERSAGCLDNAQVIADEAGLLQEMDQIRQQVLAQAPARIQQQPEKTEEVEEESQQHDPVMSAKVNRIGVRNYLAGKPGQAIRYFGMAFEHDNNNVSALLNLGQLFLEAARDTPSRSDERMKMFQRYMRLAERLPFNQLQHDKFQHLKKLSTIEMTALPDGPIGNLLK
ncbi:MAG: histidine kinase, partial [Motiliproteus sp.]|nr:histidine kinase [Motiliproteus sp.]